MIDIKYLEKYGDERYKHFSYGKGIKEAEFLFNGECFAYLYEIEKKIHSNTLKPEEKLLYWVFSMVEEIKRVDFDSKYIFHNLVPKARNINSIKIGVVIGSFIYTFSPLSSKIYKSENNIFKSEKLKAHIIVFSHDAKTQLFYGEFHKMLSLLNLGHAILNIEYALMKIGFQYKHSEDVILSKDSYDKMLKGYININKVIEVNLPSCNFSGGKSMKVCENMHSKKLIKTDINYLTKTLESFTKDNFILRNSYQKKIGDRVGAKKLSNKAMNELLDIINEVSKKADIQLYFFINDVEGYERGYYRFEYKNLKKISATDNILEHENLIYEYKDYTNFNNINFWVFFNINNYRDRKDNKLDFVYMGIIAQLISVYVAKFKCGARGIKNYNDIHIKKNFNLSENDLVGYSVSVFPITSKSQMYIL